MQLVVIGGGIAGLGTALACARDGHAVTILERDDTPMPASADDAFAWKRTGAPQVRPPYGYLAGTLKAVGGVRGTHSILRELESLRELNQRISEIGSTIYAWLMELR